MKKDVKTILINQLQDNKDPRFSFWLLLPGILIGTIWSLWNAIKSSDNSINIFFDHLIWPGIIIFIITTVIAILGWQLDID